ncbi:plasmid replication protein [Buchnera aphidicola]|uniref:plasmid replication protein n=1 Tax=Buchnera aphidicola TaxID=9 RepID=UPI0031B82680
MLSNKKKKIKYNEKTNYISKNHMILFSHNSTISNKNQFSNTIELYDAIPKYIWNNKIKFNYLSEMIITRYCLLQGQRLIIKIKPAIIEKKKKIVFIYPGAREEILEDTLRKLAIEGKGQVIEGKFGVFFTLYELQKELKKINHGYNLNEIKEAIQVCQSANIECSSKDKKIFISSGFFPVISLSKKKCKINNKNTCYVQFHPLVNYSIHNLSFREYNYNLCMQIRSPLARYIYKRMSHYWRQANIMSPYTLSLFNFLKCSSRILSIRISENIRAMKNSLTILIEKKIINTYNTIKIKSNRKIVDVKYIIFPHDNFIQQTINANKTTQKIKKISLNINNNLFKK